MDFNSLINTIATLFLLMITGFVANKLKIIDQNCSEKLSTIIIKIGQPALIISSLINADYSVENVKLGLSSLLLGVLLHIFVGILAFIACKPIRDLDDRKLTEIAMVFGNAGFIGFPILESLFGARGLFMGAFFIISFHLTLWTWGIAILARKRDDIKLTIKKVFINFGTIPSAIGIALFLINIEMPKFLTSTIGYLGNLCTPVSMLIIGALLGRSQLKKLFTTFKVYYLCAMKLVVIPLIVAIVMRLSGIFTSDMILFMTAFSALPCATAISMFAELYKIKPEYSAQLVGMSSILSILTIPLVMKCTEFIINF